MIRVWRGYVRCLMLCEILGGVIFFCEFYVALVCCGAVLRLGLSLGDFENRKADDMG